MNIPCPRCEDLQRLDHTRATPQKNACVLCFGQRVVTPELRTAYRLTFPKTTIEYGLDGTDFDKLWSIVGPMHDISGEETE